MQQDCRGDLLTQYHLKTRGLRNTWDGYYCQKMVNFLSNAEMTDGKTTVFFSACANASLRGKKTLLHPRSYETSSKFNFYLNSRFILLGCMCACVKIVLFQIIANVTQQLLLWIFDYWIKSLKKFSFIKWNDQRSSLSLTLMLLGLGFSFSMVINNKTQCNAGRGRQVREKKSKQRKMHPAKQK